MFLGALFLTVTLASCDNTDFLAWKQKFSKKYNSFEAGQLAIKNWLENKEVVSRSHVDGGKWKAELGKYADMSIMEFEAMLLENTPVDKIQQIPRKLVRPSGDTSPNAFDWRYDSNTSVVTSVKDQGFVGTCWAFSTIENVEGQWALAGNDLTDLSPEYLVDCDGSSDDTHADCSIYGGWPYLAYDFIIGKGGVPSEASWPYCSGNGSCYPCMLGPISLCGPPPYYCDRDIPASCNSMEPAATISSWTAIESDEKVMAEALVSQGPLSVLIDATGLQYYKEGKLYMLYILYTLFPYNCIQMLNDYSL